MESAQKARKGRKKSEAPKKTPKKTVPSTEPPVPKPKRKPKTPVPYDPRQGMSKPGQSAWADYIWGMKVPN